MELEAKNLDQPAKGKVLLTNYTLIKPKECNSVEMIGAVENNTTSAK